MLGQVGYIPWRRAESDSAEKSGRESARCLSRRSGRTAPYSSQLRKPAPTKNKYNNRKSKALQKKNKILLGNCKNMRFPSIYVLFNLNFVVIFWWNDEVRGVEQRFPLDLLVLQVLNFQGEQDDLVIHVQQLGQGHKGLACKKRLLYPPQFK